MKVNVLAFGIAKDILGYSSSDFTLDEKSSIAELKKVHVNAHPRSKK